MPEVFRTWAAHGIAVHCYDAHGHGFSDPKDEYDRYLIWDFNHIVSALLSHLSAHHTCKASYLSWDLKKLWQVHQYSLGHKLWAVVLPAMQELSWKLVLCHRASLILKIICIRLVYFSYYRRRKPLCKNVMKSQISTCIAAPWVKD